MADEHNRPRTNRSNSRYTGLSILVLSCLLMTPLVSLAAKVPANFKSYATTDVGGGLSCVVGATTKNGEGWDARAYVYLEETASHKLRWLTPIPVHQGWYQNRASHCVASDDHIYALIQSDTNSVPVLSQTLISIATLNEANGHLETDEMVKVPDLKGAHTVFVYDGAENFRIEEGKISVTGEWATKGDASGTRAPFKTSVPAAPAH